MTNPIVRVITKRDWEFTNRLSHEKVILPAGEYTLELVNSPSWETEV
jgi:hypothetical protein